MRPWVQFHYDAPLPSPQKSKDIKPGAVWWHMPTIPVLRRERQVVSLFCWALLATANSILKFFEVSHVAQADLEVLPEAYLLPQPSKC